MNLKDMLNAVLGQSGFLQRDAFATSTDPDNIQMVAFANRAANEIRERFPWNRLRQSTSVTLIEGQVSYPLPDDFDYYMTETMWKSFGARHVVIPTSDRYWSFIKAGNPGTRINYYAKFIQGKLEFTAVSGGDVINFDYMSKYAITDSGGTPKEQFTEDTDLFLLSDHTLIRGTQAYWKIEKEIMTGLKDEKDFEQHIKRDIAADTPAKVIRSGVREDRYYPYAPPISQDYVW